jgi:hypothetical protein
MRLLTLEGHAGALPPKPGQKSDPPGIFGYLLRAWLACSARFRQQRDDRSAPELRQRTLERYHVVAYHLTPFVAGKVVFAVVVFCCAA